MNILKKSSITGTLIVILAALPIAAFAGEAPSHGQMSFAAFDKDGNGWVSKKEFNHVVSQIMARGKPANGAAPAFSDFDKNGDGKLSKSELGAGH